MSGVRSIIPVTKRAAENRQPHKARGAKRLVAFSTSRVCVRYCTLLDRDADEVSGGACVRKPDRDTVEVSDGITKKGQSPNGYSKLSFDFTRL